MGDEFLPGISERSLRNALAVAAAIAVVLGFVVLTVINIANGSRQRREGGGTLRRLVWISLAFALLEGSPILLAFAAYFLLDEEDSDRTAVVMGVACLINFVVLRQFLKPPRKGTEPPGLVKDASLLARVAEISHNMAIDVPPVRLRRTLGGVEAAQARVQGIIVPTLIVTDGILDRLTALERDAILAHELAHIANRSLWLLALACPVSAALSLGIASFVPGWVAIVLLVVSYSGLIRIISRFIERDCDSRAGRAVGYAEMASALRKIHAIHAFRGARWREQLRFATATHPHLESRTAALSRAAEKAGRESIPYSADVVRRQRRLSWIALFVWFVLISLTIFVTWRAEPPLWVPALLFAVYVAARLWIPTDRRRVRKIYGRRMGIGRFAKLWPVIPVLMIPLFWLVISSGLITDPLYQAGAALSAVTFSILVLAGGDRKRRDSDLLAYTREALAARNFAGVFELARQNAKRVSRNPRLRHNVALATALSGDRAGAISQLEQLRTDLPRFKMASFLLVSLYLAEDERGRAYEVARQIATDLPLDPGAQYLLARAARRSVELQQAQEAIDRSLALEAGGEATALAAGIAADTGDFDRARELIQSAHARAPGGAQVLVEEAHLLLRTESADVAYAAVQKAIEKARANPFTLLDYEIKQLENALDSIATRNILVDRTEN